MVSVSCSFSRSFVGLTSCSQHLGTAQLTVRILGRTSLIGFRQSHPTAHLDRPYQIMGETAIQKARRPQRHNDMPMDVRIISAAAVAPDGPAAQGGATITAAVVVPKSASAHSGPVTLVTVLCIWHWGWCDCKWCQQRWASLSRHQRKQTARGAYTAYRDYQHHHPRHRHCWRYYCLCFW